MTKLYSAPEVASLLGVELDTLYRYARQGRISGLKIGKFWRFTESDIEAFVRGHRSRADGAQSPYRLMPDLLRQAGQKAGAGGGVDSVHGKRSYAEIDRLSDRLARALIDKGIEPGERVLVALPNSAEFVIACFAVWKARAVLVPESTAIRAGNLLHVLNDSRASAFILHRSMAERLEGTAVAFDSLKAVFVKDRTFALTGVNRAEVESLDAVLESDSPFDPPDWTSARPDDVVSITYTSGSTGTPKGVLHTHESWLVSAEFTRDHAGVTASDTIVIPLPLYHGLAFRQILAYIMANATIILAADIYQALRWLKERRATALVLVPAASHIVMDHFASVLREIGGDLRYVEIGSAAMPPDRLKRLRELLPATTMLLPYGLTEARVGFLKVGEDGLLNQIAAVAHGLELQIVDSQGQPVKHGESGEIRLKGRGLMKGYWGQSDHEHARIAAEGFRTGDMGRINRNGQPELLGRLDDVLKVGGRKVIPQEVEMVLNRQPDVAESAVVGLPDPAGIFEHTLHAFVVLKRAFEPAVEKRILAHCREHLEPHKVPAHVHFRKSLPKSAVGKILRHEIQFEPAA